MIDIGKEANAFASWPTQERLHALKRIIPRARVERSWPVPAKIAPFRSSLAGPRGASGW